MDPADTAVRLLQASLAPVALISGVGLLLLSMTNRFGRVIDRSRILAREIRKAPDVEVEGLRSQITILRVRCRRLQLACSWAAFSILLDGLLILLLFAAVLFEINLIWPIVATFAASIAFLSLSLVAFIRDITHSLQAMRVDLDEL
jgi:hypothetical protein